MSFPPFPLPLFFLFPFPQELVFTADPALLINARAWEKGNQSISCSMSAGEPDALHCSKLNLLKAKEKLHVHGKKVEAISMKLVFWKGLGSKWHQGPQDSSVNEGVKMLAELSLWVPHSRLSSSKFGYLRQCNSSASLECPCMLGAVLMLINRSWPFFPVKKEMKTTVLATLGLSSHSDAVAAVVLP